MNSSSELESTSLWNQPACSSTTNRNCPTLVIGAGVSGLTTALALRQTGAEVTVVADQFAPRVTSVVAGALWEWPPAVCGSHHNLTSLARSKNWAAASYEIFRSLAADPDTGVFLRPANFYFKYAVGDRLLEQAKMMEFRDRVSGFTHDARLITQNGVSSSSGVRDAYRFLAPMVDTDVYMQWLMEKVRAAGCRIVHRRLDTHLNEIEAALKKEYGVEWIINCSGLGARELARDHVYPLRGALVRLHNNIGLTEAHCVSHDPADPDPYFIFILPRGRDRILVGGLAEENEWDINLMLDHPRVRAMWERCLDFFPKLRDAKMDQAEPVRTGLRPARPSNVRLEREPNTCIIHNYGHGGSGVTFSWGCAHEIARMIGSASAEHHSTRNAANTHRIAVSV